MSLLRRRMMMARKSSGDITFTLLGDIYNAPRGILWHEWYRGGYDTKNIIANDDWEIPIGGHSLINLSGVDITDSKGRYVTDYNEIVNGEVYKLKSGGAFPV